MAAEKSYIHYLSVLKCVGMLAVIGIHVFCTPVTHWSDSYDKAGLYVSFFAASVLRAWAVPVFVMVSGALFLGRTTSVGAMYKKYMLRLVITLLTFGALFALMELVFTERSVSARLLLRAFRNVYAGESWTHLWFVYMCIGLYAVAPLLQRLLCQLDDELLRYMLALLFVFTCLVPTVNALTGVPFGVYLPVSGIWLFYYVLGYALHTGRVRVPTWFCAAGIALGVAWCAFGQLLPNMRIVYGAGIRFADPSDIIGVLMATSIFSLAKTACKQTTDFVDTVINPLSYGVYVIHALFLNVLYKVVRLTPERYNVVLMWSVAYLVTLAGSLLVVWLLRKIPVVRKYVL